ncbi:hypothetical protein [Yinghuangia seranimata]|uniref:hypothetical protein n=1 Tax=Yinghuangia seranimata TaxID=408067 RepID=UPI00248AB692|nr:hypothetical protein [Yinghuangia seranimata]MDI2131768.1 hypothetical protein [Yinghuangia seranimata]
MAIATDIRKTLTDATPLYAVVGAGDLAVEKIREVPDRLSGVTFERPKFEVPKIDLPKFEVPKFEVPKFEMPKFERPDVPTDPKVIREKVAGAATEVQKRATSTFSALSEAGKDARDTLPGKAQDFAKVQYGKAGDYADRLREIYEELAVRGHKVVDRLTHKEQAESPAAEEPAAEPVPEPVAEPAAEPAAAEAKPAPKPKPAAKRAAKKATPPPAE